MAKRAFQAVVLFFAICGFLFVPLGKRTAIEHLQAIAGTPAAQQAGTELKRGVLRLFDRLRSRAGEESESDGDARYDEGSGARGAESKPRPRLAPRPPKGDKPRATERRPPATASQAPRSD